ncbi:MULTISPECIES: HNH endonuclease [unclassified Clostridioides]|uniref:HNH endonuclease n=1 Tax=unclassified Clostridioides TaxID=2635829 RepID=UPI001D109763|nr:hypothetical protein [Clostridioides sp. ES-S-0145-01]MCC0681841.1 hypothetical protein [Clostridioides sp. ES-S-0005-03]MCC0709261.1 hypothetical protein [Clostridioides sp. ES-S-0190-01]UDN64038.1 hypothetical protein IC758_20840 [Clostridioides sp. ES-W-0016-02]
MNVCIYSKKSEPEANFKKQEHIFPASLGGKSTLPKGYVSDEINEKFSKELELDFTREGFLAILRQFIGPGSRGNINNPKKATQSKVHLILDEDDNNALGYIVKGVPKYIKQIIFNLEYGALSNSTKLFLPKAENEMEELEKFLQADYSNTTVIKDSYIPKNKIMLGFKEYQEKGRGSIKQKWFIGHNPEVTINDELKDKMEILIKKLYENSIGKEDDSIVESQHVKSYQSIRFDIEKFYRTCAKIAFNYVASVVGQEIVLGEEFDDIRNYIVNGGNGDFVEDVNAIVDPKAKQRTNYLGVKHAIIAFSVENEIIVFLSFYGEFDFIVRIPYKIDICKLREVLNKQVIVINWENRCEEKIPTKKELLDQKFEELLKEEV